MKTLLTVGAVFLATCSSCLAEDPVLGHVNLPKGKYVLTNIDTRLTTNLTIDDHGIVRGSKQAPAQTATQSATGQATAAASSTTAKTAAPAESKTTSTIIKDKIKKEAERAIRRGDVQKLIKKVGID